MAENDKDISGLIADYFNNRLDAKTKTEFESRLQEDQELLDACNDFQGFQKLYRQIDPTEPSPSDALFAQITGTISASQKAERKVPVLQSIPLVESLRSFWQQIRQSIALPWMFAAVQAVVIVLLLVPASQDNTYTTLSLAENPGNADKSSINVVFRPTATEADIRNLLHGIQGSLSSGPSSEGRYVVSISSQSDLDMAVRTLKQSENVVFAEPFF